ncbi:MAG: metal-dependent transcriptional regulator, partial [Erysipelotrichaceae bacterium]
MENYLEAILVIKKNKGKVFSIDVANYLNFSKASVSIAMKKLLDKSLIIRLKDNT